MNVRVLENRAPTKDKEGVDVPNKEGTPPEGITAVVPRILELEEVPNLKGDEIEFMES